MVYHYAVHPSYVKLHAGTQEVTNLERLLFEAGIRADVSTRITIARLNAETRRVQQSVAAYFRGDGDEETK